MKELVYYPNLQIADHFELPLRTDSMRFAVLLRNGLSSHAWRVWSEPPGNVYIVCRDTMREIKVSLHRSGKQHVAFSSESDLEMTEGSRFWDQWREPVEQGEPKLTPSFRLLFPSWGLNVTETMRDSNKKVWDKNQLFLEGAESPLATIVSFVITDDDLTIDFTPVGETPNFPLGILPARSGKKLWVVAEYAPEGNMMEGARVGMSGLYGRMVGEDPPDVPFGKPLDMCVVGRNTSEMRYLMPFQAIQRKPTDEVHEGPRAHI